MIANSFQLQSLRQKIQNMNNIQRTDFFKSLNKDQLNLFYRYPTLKLYDKQIAPAGDWRYHWFQGARGTGKTVASTAWLVEKIMNGAEEVAIMGPDYGTLIKEILPTFESHFHPNHKPKYNYKDNLYRLSLSTHNCIVKCYSSDTEPRGLNAEYAIAEELCKWCDSIPEKIETTWTIFNLGVRNKRAKPPQIYISTTPKPFPWFIKFLKQIEDNNPLYSRTLAIMDDNPYLSPHARQALVDELGGTRLGKQELYAEILTDTPGALWTHDLIQDTRVNQDKELLDILVKVVIAVDPAITANANSDETGILVVGLGNDDHAYVLADLSGVYTPDKWSEKVNNAYSEWQANFIVAEKNQGGDLVMSNLRTRNPFLPVKLIHATKGKITRMEPIAALFEQKKAHLAGHFGRLEQQMCSYTGNKDDSPDRADAMCYAISELMLGRTYATRQAPNIKGF